MKKPQIASIDQVKIRREGTCAVIEYNDSSIPTIHFEIGDSIQDMKDQEILDHFNFSVEIQQQMAADYNHVAVEIPADQPQIRYDPDALQWIPRGDVLRCTISDGGPDYATSILVDEHDLSLSEFGRLLSTYNGWGMRITFVPDDELLKRPKIKVQYPGDDK